MMMILCLLSRCNVTVMISYLRIFYRGYLVCGGCFYEGSLTGCFIKSISKRLLPVLRNFEISLALFEEIIHVLILSMILLVRHIYLVI